jgi:hypothetical protein
MRTAAAAGPVPEVLGPSPTELPRRALAHRDVLEVL